MSATMTTIPEVYRTEATRLVDDIASEERDAWGETWRLVVVDWLEDSLVLLRDKVTGELDLTVWSQHYANGFFMAREGTHERVATLGEAWLGRSRSEGRDFYLLADEVADAVAMILALDADPEAYEGNSREWFEAFDLTHADAVAAGFSPELTCLECGAVTGDEHDHDDRGRIYCQKHCPECDEDA